MTATSSSSSAKPSSRSSVMPARLRHAPTDPDPPAGAHRPDQATERYCRGRYSGPVRGGHNHLGHFRHAPGGRRRRPARHPPAPVRTRHRGPPARGRRQAAAGDCRELRSAAPGQAGGQEAAQGRQRPTRRVDRSEERSVARRRKWGSSWLPPAGPQPAALLDAVAHPEVEVFAHAHDAAGRGRQWMGRGDPPSLHYRASGPAAHHPPGGSARGPWP